MQRIEGGARNQGGHHAHAAAPVAAGVIDGDGELEIEPPAPALQLVLEEDVVRARMPYEKDNPAEARPLGKEPVDRRPQRSEAEPPATMTTSEPTASSTGQPRPNGPRTPIVSPAFSRVSASETLPTARMV